jgi:hypothetical protein
MAQDKVLRYADSGQNRGEGAVDRAGAASLPQSIETDKLPLMAACHRSNEEG